MRAGRSAVGTRCQEDMPRQRYVHMIDDDLVGRQTLPVELQPVDVTADVEGLVRDAVLGGVLSEIAHLTDGAASVRRLLHLRVNLAGKTDEIYPFVPPLHIECAVRRREDIGGVIVSLRVHGVLGLVEQRIPHATLVGLRGEHGA